MTPIRVTYNQVCEMLAIKRNKLNELMRNDETFPRAYKDGTSRQSKVYFDYQSIVEWHKNKLQESTA
ncbi:MAG: transcriptional regulator [Acinetobacter sp.]|nr:transcriptional regulator [Acinetobacter sp.]